MPSEDNRASTLRQDPSTSFRATKAWSTTWQLDRIMLCYAVHTVLRHFHALKYTLLSPIWRTTRARIHALGGSPGSSTFRSTCAATFHKTTQDPKQDRGERRAEETRGDERRGIVEIEASGKDRQGRVRRGHGTVEMGRQLHVATPTGRTPSMAVSIYHTPSPQWCQQTGELKNRHRGGPSCSRER